MSATKATQFVKTGVTSAFDENLFNSANQPAGDQAGKSTEETPLQEDPTSQSETPQDSDEDKSSARDTTSNFRLAALQVDAVEEVEQLGPDVGGAQEASDALETEIETIEASESVEASEAEAIEEVAVIEADSEGSADAADSSAGQETKAADEKPVEYEPLSEVSDSIRDKLATDKAVVELKDTMGRIYGELQSEYNPYGFAVVSARSEDKAPPAPPEKLINLKARANEAGLISEETALLTQRELADTFVGKAFDAQTNRNFVVQAAFSTLGLYEP